ncbi:hypothetical protein Golob_014775, partial [Gossypium lobatum]|nr:hypothetical protein [Gossypium lobatum]
MMHDGTIRTLSDVRHVPNLKNNLISMGIDLKGCRINIDSNSINVSCGALFFMEGKKIGCLYVSKGSTVTGETR